MSIRSTKSEECRLLRELLETARSLRDNRRAKVGMLANIKAMLRAARCPNLAPRRMPAGLLAHSQQMMHADWIAAHNAVVEAEGLPLDAWRVF